MTADIVDRLFDPSGVWPWAEANQGLLSVVALAAAIGVAVWEIRQSARRDLRVLTEYVDWVLNCANRAIELTDDAIRYVETEGRDAEGISIPVWQMLTRNALATLEEIQPMRPAHPTLTHYVNRLMRCMAQEVQDSPYAQYNKVNLLDFRTYVLIHRDHVQRFRPKSLGDRLRGVFMRRRRGKAATDPRFEDAS